MAVTASDRILDAAFRRNRWELLGAAVLLGVLACGPWGIAAMAWFAPIPWLHYLRTNSDRRARVWFAAAQAAMHLLVVAKGFLGPAGPVSDAFVAAPWREVIAASLVISLGHLVWRAAAQRLSNHLGVLAFALLMLVTDGVVRALLPGAATVLLPGGGGMGETQMLLGAAVGEAGSMLFLRWLPAALEANWETVHPVALRRHLAMAVLALGLALVVGRVSSIGHTAPASAVPESAASPWPTVTALLGVGALFVFERLERHAAARRATRGIVDPW
jgi:hypothetical protein